MYKTFQFIIAGKEIFGASYTSFSGFGLSKIQYTPNPVLTRIQKNEVDLIYQWEMGKHETITTMANNTLLTKVSPSQCLYEYSINFCLSIIYPNMRYFETCLNLKSEVAEIFPH